MSITISPEALKDVFGEALLAALPAATREALLQNAISYLITPPPGDSYNRKPPSPIQFAFQTALHAMGHDLAKQLLESDPAVKAQVRALLTDALELAFGKNRDELVEKLASVISRGLLREER